MKKTSLAKSFLSTVSLIEVANLKELLEHIDITEENKKTVIEFLSCLHGLEFHRESIIRNLADYLNEVETDVCSKRMYSSIRDIIITVKELERIWKEYFQLNKIEA